ncbi:MAG TPA: lysophospholipid acyltransferase family protein [candidate division Zixibacteria bacterium]|nr:lysophospholipid acyltransferase family protein [candidate division Zixibacteria bacterium]
MSDPELQRQLIQELDDLMVRVRKVIPDYTPPPYTSPEMGVTQDEPSEEETPSSPLSLLDRVRGVFREDLLDRETWKGLWYMASNTLEYQSDLLKRRISGDYEIDEWGLDWELIETTRPFLDFLYNYFWRVQCAGMEKIPDYERTVLVCNHTDQPPWDPILLMAAFLNEHPAQRLVRNLYSAEIPALPFLSSLAVKTGQALNSVDNGVRLLEQEELVSVFPEGYSLKGRNSQERLKVSRFKDTGFVQMAMETSSPIVPVSFISSADTLFHRSRQAARKRAAQFPAMANFLQLPSRRMGSMLPVPSKVVIEFGEPIWPSELDMGQYTELEIYSRVADMARTSIQDMITNRLEQEEMGSG